MPQIWKWIHEKKTKKRIQETTWKGQMPLPDNTSQFISKLMAYKLHFTLLFYVAYSVQRYLWTHIIECNYPTKWSIQHPVLEQSQSGYMLNMVWLVLWFDAYSLHDVGLKWQCNDSNSQWNAPTSGNVQVPRMPQQSEPANQFMNSQGKKLLHKL